MHEKFKGFSLHIPKSVNLELLNFNAGFENTYFILFYFFLPFCVFLLSPDMGACWNLVGGECNPVNICTHLF